MFSTRSKMRIVAAIGSNSQITKILESRGMYVDTINKVQMVGSFRACEFFSTARD